MAGECKICGATLSQVLLEIRTPDRFERSCGITSLGYLRRWIECGGCGAVTNVLQPDARLKLARLRNSYYEVDFDGSDIEVKYNKVMSLPPELSDNSGRVTRIVNFLARWQTHIQSRRVLDIGAGTGVFLSRFLRTVSSSWEAVAIEPDPTAAHHLRRLGLFSVVESRFPGQHDLSGFDLITLNKVLEHVDDPLSLLRSVIVALSPGMSILYVELPDKLTIDRRSPEDNILGSLHCHLYDPSSAIRLLRLAGFEPLRAERVIEPSGKISVFVFACLPQALSGL